MLGLGTSITSIDSELIYRELSELVNYTDLDVHYDWSNETTNMGYADGDAVEEAENLGAGGVTNRIATYAGGPKMDRTNMGRGSVLFDGTDDILTMAAAYTTTAKQFTLFWVFQKANTDNEFLFSSITENDDIPDDYIRLADEDTFQFAMQNQTAVNINTDNSVVDYDMVANVSTVYVIRRLSGGSVVIYADNGLSIATKGNTAVKAGATIEIGRLGGTIEGEFVELTGNIGEFGIYDVDIGDAAAITLSKELSKKWGVSRTS